MSFPRTALLCPIYQDLPLANVLSIESLVISRPVRVIRAHGCAELHWARSLLIHAAMQTDLEIFVFVDSDSVFDVEDYDRVVASCLETRGIVGAPYPSSKLDRVVGDDLLAPLPTSGELGMQEVAYLGLGLTAIHRSVVDGVSAGIEPIEIFPGMPPMRALFLPTIIDGALLSEDVAFCYRARDAGFKCWLETRARCRHVKQFAFGIADIELTDGRAAPLLVDVEITR